MRDRINCPFQPPQVLAKVHRQYQKMSVEEKLPLMHDMTYHEAQTMFIDHVRQVVFVDHVRDHHTPGVVARVQKHHGDTHNAYQIWRLSQAT